MTSASTAIADRQTAPPQIDAGRQQEQKTPSRPNPDIFGIYHAGDGVTEPKLIYSVVPEFSDRARKRKLSGSIILQLIVGADGHVEKVQITKSASDGLTNKKDRKAALTLDQKAVEAASQYRFQPGTFQGRPVMAETPIKMHFQIF
jgi:TonB family protein